MFQEVNFKQNKFIMEKYNLPDDVKVFGVQVKTFPHGIGEAFDGLRDPACKIL